MIGLLSCSVLRMHQSLKFTKEDWTMYGGSIERTNVAHSAVKPPLAVVWEYDASAGFSQYSAIAVDSFLFVPNLQGEVHVVQVGTGKAVGVYDFGSALVGTPVVDKNFLYVALTRDDNNLVAYNLVSGVIEWRAKVGDVESSPLLVEKRLYVTTLQGKLLCVETFSGTIVWTFEVPSHTRTTIIRSSPASDGSVVVFGCDSGELYAVGIEDGKLRWRATTAGSIAGSPSIGGGKVFVGSTDGMFNAFDVESGKRVWKQDLGSQIYASQVISSTSVYVGTSGQTVYCLDAGSGAIKWKATTKSVVSAPPLLSGDVLYVGCMDKTLYAFDADSGELRWHYETEGRIKTMPIVWKDYLFVLTEDRSVLAFKHSTQP